MKWFLTLLVCLFAGQTSGASQTSQKITEKSTEPTVTILWPPIPKGEISVLVENAMLQARRGNSDLAAGVSR